jgi:DNA-directed RNA polymerase alpha subunit
VTKQFAGASRSTTQPESDFPAKLAAPAQRALANAGYVRLDQLTQLSEAELLKLHGMGPKAIGQLRQALQEKGLSFANKA